MTMSHFNYQTMTAYRKSKGMRGYNPFDYPEEWEFFKHPFETDEEDDILTNLLFQIRKMTRRLHLYFDVDGRSETAFYFGFLDSLSETEDYLFGALKYARYCRLENLFFLTAHEDLGGFIEKLSRLKDELFSKISSFGENTAELNQNCYDGNLFLRQYCELTQNGIPDDMLHALLRLPDFPSDLSKPLKLDKKANIWSYFNNATTELEFTEEEQNIEGAFDTSKLEEKLQPVDMLLWHIRGTLLWLVIKKIRWVCSNADALGHRHNKLVETMCKNAYDEVCDVYARSKAYAKRRDEEFLQQCGDYLYLQGRKPTIAEMHTYFNQQYRNLILSQNQSNQLYLRCRKQEGTFYVGFLNNLLKEETRQDAEDFLFCQTFGKELSTKQTTTGKNSPFDAIQESFANARAQSTIPVLEVGKLITKELKIENGGHLHFPACLSIEVALSFYKFLSQNGFIDEKETPLEDFNYLMGATTQYTTPSAPKPICWLKNRQMLREMLKLAFAPLLKNGTTLSSLAKFVPTSFVDKKGKPLKLANNDERQIVLQELDALKIFFATISRPE